MRLILRSKSGVDPLYSGCGRQLRCNPRCLGETGIRQRDRVSLAVCQLYVHAVCDVAICVVFDRSESNAFIKRTIDNSLCPSAERSPRYLEPSRNQFNLGDPLPGDDMEEDACKEQKSNEDTCVLWQRGCSRAPRSQGVDVDPNDKDCKQISNPSEPTELNMGSREAKTSFWPGRSM